MQLQKQPKEANNESGITSMKTTNKAFRAFIKKEFFHIFRDVRTMMIVLFMPIIQILLFGFALSAEVNNVNFAVFDVSKDSISRKIIHTFSQSKYFDLKKEITNPSELSSIFNDNRIDLVLVFGNDFYKTNSLQFLLDASDPNYASMINLYATNVASMTLLDLQRNESAFEPNTSDTSATQDSNENPDSNYQYNANNANLSAISAQTMITPLTTMLFNPQGESAYNFVPGLLGMVLMLICAMMTSISIVREKEQGSMEVLLVSPIKPMLMIAAKLIPYFVISFVSLVAILLVSVFVLELKIAGNIFFVIAFCMLYIVLALSVGLLVSNLVSMQITAMLICGLVFMMPVMMLSGMIFPLESMPKILQCIAMILPPNWFISGLKKIMIEGLGFAFVIKEIAVLGTMLLVVSLISIKRFNIRLER